MGIIREPKGVDFIVGPGRPSEQDFKKISTFIKKDKAEKAKELAKKETSKSSRKSKAA